MATTTTTPVGDARTRGAALLVLGSIVSVQSGAALATGLFDSVGPAGAVFLRASFGALALILFTRGAPLRTREWPHRDVWLLSISVAAVNLFFYAALDRLPLGITVTLEFVGPLGSPSSARTSGVTSSGRCSPRSGSSSSPTAPAARESTRSAWCWR